MLAFFCEPKPSHGLPDLAAPLTSTTYFSFWGRQAQEVACSPSQGKDPRVFSSRTFVLFCTCWLLQKTTRSLSFRLPNYVFIRAHWWWGENWHFPSPPPIHEEQDGDFPDGKMSEFFPPCQAWVWLCGIRKVLCGNREAGLCSVSWSVEERGRDHHFLIPLDVCALQLGLVFLWPNPCKINLGRILLPAAFLAPSALKSPTKNSHMGPCRSVPFLLPTGGVSDSGVTSSRGLKMCRCGT